MSLFPVQRFTQRPTEGDGIKQDPEVLRAVQSQAAVPVLRVSEKETGPGHFPAPSPPLSQCLLPFTMQGPVPGASGKFL